MSEAGEAIRFEGVTKRFGDATAVDDLNLTIGRASSSRCSGRRAAARRRRCGWSPASSSRPRASVLLEGEPVEKVPPYKRNVNTVFQSYALFEHLDVVENVAFGLKRRKVGAGRDPRRAWRRRSSSSS